MIDVRVLINTDFGRARGKCRWRQELDKIVIWRCLTPPTVWPYLQQFELHYRSKLYTLPPTPTLLPFPSSLDYCQGKCLKARLIKVASSDRQIGKEGEGRGRARLRAKVSGARWLAARVQSIWKISSVIHIQDAQRCSRTIKRWQRNESKWAEVLKGAAGRREMPKKEINYTSRWKSIPSPPKVTEITAEHRQ